MAHTTPNPKSKEAPGHPNIVPPAKESKNDSHNTEKKKFPWWRIVEAIGILAAVVVAAVNSLQWHDANRNFRTDQRPWLTFETALATKSVENPDGTMSIPVKSSEPFSVPVSIRNSGKTPATDIHGAAMIQIVDRAGGNLILPSGRFTSGSPSIGVLDMDLGILFPGQDSVKVEVTRYGIANGKQDVASLTVAEVNSLAAGTSRIYLTGKLTTETDSESSIGLPFVKRSGQQPKACAARNTMQ